MSEPTILVDLLYFTGKRGGTETYLRQVVTRLPNLMPGVRFHAVTNRVGDERVRGFFPGDVTCVRAVGEDVIAWPLGEVFAVQRVAARVGASAVWCPANVGPQRGKVPVVLTLHDVIYHSARSRGIAGAKRRVVARLIAGTARSAAAVMTDSEAAADEIVRYIQLDREAIDVVLLGAEPPTPVAVSDNALEGLGMVSGRPVLLSTGNRMPHKNFDGLLRAIAAMPARMRPLTVITGSHGEDPLKRIVDELGLADDVLLLGWVTKEQLEALYQVASVYACPSLVEGFGLPVIDAMSRGCVVVANDVAVLREVGGDAARYADATSPTDFAAEITAALADEQRAERVGRGRSYAAEFTWDRTAAHVAAHLQRVAASEARYS